MHTLRIILLVSLTAAILPGCGSGGKDSPEQHAEVQGQDVYTCPMHPSVLSDRPGACPVCGMALVKKSAGHQASEEELAGLHQVSLSPTQRVIANVSTSVVGRSRVSHAIAGVGIVEIAEPGRSDVTARFRGRIEKLYVNYSGQVVGKNDLLFELYSPDLVAAQQELIVAANAAGRDSALEHDLLGAARERLTVRYGMTASQIHAIITSGKMEMTVLFHSPIAGTVISKNVVEGQYVDEGSVLYRLADLSVVWVWLDVYERDIASVRIGQKVKMTAEAYPSRTFSGSVTFIEPVVNPETRTIRVRCEFNNSDGALKPQMYVRAEINVPAQSSITVPVSAVISLGSRSVAWVEVSENTFEPRSVVVGPRGKDNVAILAGLNEGDRVVTSGGYLLESESQLQLPPHETNETSGAEHPAHSEQRTGASTTIRIVVDGAYTPNVINASMGRPITIEFDRKDDSHCTDEVMFEDFNIRKKLVPHGITAVEITPQRPGSYTFTCGMKMVSGTLIVQ